MNFENFLTYIKSNVSCEASSWNVKADTQLKCFAARKHKLFDENVRFSRNKFNPHLYIFPNQTDTFDQVEEVFKSRAKAAFELSKPYLKTTAKFEDYFKWAGSTDDKGHLYGAVVQLFVPLSSCDFDEISDEEKKNIVRAYQVLIDAENDIGIKECDFKKSQKKDLKLTGEEEENFTTLHSSHKRVVKSSKLSVKEVAELGHAIAKMKNLNEVIQKEECFASKFNILAVLGLSDYEIRHSFMLAWLLNPSGTHNLGDLFLREFSKQIRSANIEREAEYSALQNLCGKVKVEREYNDIDIFLVDAQHKIVLVVENKWNANEREDSAQKEGQLTKYRKWVENKYGGDDWRRIYIFLTPDGRSPSKLEWGVLSYEGVLKALKMIIDDTSQRIDFEVKILIQHYISILERKVAMETKEIEQECLKLYKEHGKALRFMMEKFGNKHPVLIELLTRNVQLDLDGKKESFKEESNADVYIQFKRRLPAKSSQSVHYEVVEKKRNERIAICLHVEDKTIPSAKEMLCKRIEEKIQKIALPDGFNFDSEKCEVKHEITLAKDFDEDYAVVEKSLKSLYEWCEPILREVEAEFSEGCGSTSYGAGCIHSPTGKHEK